jgi:hypothetical protein
MKSAVNVNEIAGLTAQNLPARQSATASSVALPAISATKGRTPADSSETGNVPPRWTILQPTAQIMPSASLTTDFQGGHLPATTSIERLESLMTNEVSILKQAGAQNLAVSLKVDSHTNLFMHMSNHDGQIVVSVHCENGDARFLNAHWGALQDSFARQNIQLLPLQDKTTSSNLSSELPSQQQDHRQDGSPAQHDSPLASPQQKENTSDEAMSAAIGVTKSKHKLHKSHGWEKWA